MAEFCKKTSNSGDFKMTKEEFEKLKDAFKKKEFQDLFVEYVKEISDPENKKKYEEDIIALEKEQGYDATFIHPEPWYVLKCLTPDSKKIFINVCTNPKVGIPSHSTIETDGGKNWKIPYLMSPPHKDYDKNYNDCQVVDAIFHQSVISLSKKNSEFKKMIQDIVLEGVEEKFHFQLERNNIRTLKMKYKGMQRPLITKSKDNKTSMQSCETIGGISEHSQNENDQVKMDINPKYQIRYVSHVDIQDYAANLTCSSRPKEIIIDIMLPLILNIDAINLELLKKRFILETTNSIYKLDLCLSYPVDEKKGSAQFDKDSHKLTVKLPIVQETNEKKYFSEESEIDEVSCESEEMNCEDTISVTLHNPTFTCSENKNCACIEKESSIAPLFPHFSYDQTDEKLIFVFKVKNVSKDTVTISKCNSHSCHGISFRSVGKGYVPFNFYFQFKLPDQYCLGCDTYYDIDDNLVVVLSKAYPGIWTHFEAGVNIASYQRFDFICKANLETLWNELIQERTGDILEAKNVEMKTLSPNLVDFKVNFAKNMLILDAVPEELNSLARTSSESSEEPIPPQKYHGILKHSSNWRSISESSDDAFGHSFEQDSLQAKKTVRFNDHVSKNLYRANSSILGQRKKNQRKSKNKKNRSSSVSEESAGNESDSNFTSTAFEELVVQKSSLHEHKMNVDDDDDLESSSDTKDNECSLPSIDSASINKSRVIDGKKYRNKKRHKLGNGENEMNAQCPKSHYSQKKDCAPNDPPSHVNKPSLTLNGKEHVANKDPPIFPESFIESNRGKNLGKKRIDMLNNGDEPEGSQLNPNIEQISNDNQESTNVEDENINYKDPKEEISPECNQKNHDAFQKWEAGETPDEKREHSVMERSRGYKKPTVDDDYIDSEKTTQKGKPELETKSASLASGFALEENCDSNEAKNHISEENFAPLSDKCDIISKSAEKAQPPSSSAPPPTANQNIAPPCQAKENNLTSCPLKFRNEVVFDLD